VGDLGWQKRVRAWVARRGPWLGQDQLSCAFCDGLAALRSPFLLVQGQGHLWVCWRERLESRQPDPVCGIVPQLRGLC